MSTRFSKGTAQARRFAVPFGTNRFVPITPISLRCGQKSICAVFMARSASVSGSEFGQMFGIGELMLCQ